MCEIMQVKAKYKYYLWKVDAGKKKQEKQPEENCEENLLLRTKKWPQEAFVQTMDVYDFLTPFSAFDSWLLRLCE